MNPAPQKSLEGISILLVDDYPMNTLFAKRMLERLGATVGVAGNGQEALDKLDASKHQIVLMDIQMPVMDGYESTTLMRARGEILPIIALTASITDDISRQVQAAGMTDLLVKPFSPDALILMILQHIISRPSARPEPVKRG